MSIEDNKLKNILEAALMAVGKPMTIEQMMKLFDDENRPSATRVKEVLSQLQQDCEGRGIELKDVASGYRYQARQDYSEWLSRLWEEKPAKYSRAYLETLALIAYRQPVTRAEIEEVRGVSVSSNIVKTMLEREWIRVVGHRDVPGRPSLYATTKQFLDYFNMKSLEELPSLAEIKDLEELSPELNLPEPGQQEENDTSSAELVAGDETQSNDQEVSDLSPADDDIPLPEDDSTNIESSMETAIEEYREEMREIEAEDAEYAASHPAEESHNPFEESAFEAESYEDELYQKDIGETASEEVSDFEQSANSNESEDAGSESIPSDLSEENQSV